MKEFKDWWKGTSKNAHGTKMFNPAQMAILHSLCKQAWARDKTPCKYCEGSLKHEPNSNFCGQCGRAFNRCTMVGRPALIKFPQEKSAVEKAMQIIKQAMVEDDPSQPGSYAHSWHCNIAMMCSDAIHAAGLVEGGPLSEKAPSLIGNEAASRFMKLCFDVETKQ